jgi:hypothetical protein
MGILKGAVEKIRQRRSRHFSVLTYWKYALRAKMTAAFPSRSLRTGLGDPFERLRACFFEPPRGLKYATCLWVNMPLEIGFIQHSLKGKS